MDTNRNESVELTTVRPSVDIADCSRFEASSDMERGERSQPDGSVSGGYGQVNAEHDSSSDGRHSDEGTVPSVSKGATEQSQTTQTGWIKKLKAFCHEPVKPNERKDLVFIDRCK
jgi:hypothetical protein